MVPVCFWLYVLAALGPSEDGRFAPVASASSCRSSRSCTDHAPDLLNRARTFAISPEKWREMVSRASAPSSLRQVEEPARYTLGFYADASGDEPVLGRLGRI